MTKASIHTMEFYSKATFADFKKLYDFFRPRNAVRTKRTGQSTYYNFLYYTNGVSYISANPVIDIETQKCLCVHVHVIVNPRYAVFPLQNAASQLINPDKSGDALEDILNELYVLLPSSIFDSLILNFN